MKDSLEAIFNMFPALILLGFAALLLFKVSYILPPVAEMINSIGTTLVNMIYNAMGPLRYLMG